MAFITALAAQGAAQAAPQIYKWTDEQGRVHYTQTPPPDMQEAAPLDVKVARPPAQEEPAEEAAGEGEASGKETPEAPVADDAPIAIVPKEQAKAQCEDARKRLEILKGEAAHLMVRDASGELRPLSAEERDKRIADEESRVRQFCIEQ
jgi:hypothetical protein